MIVTYLSPSAMENARACQQKYFIGSVLRHRFEAGKAALLGTICHKVLELLGLRKLNENKNITEFDDEDLGLIRIEECEPDLLLRRSYDYYTKKSTYSYQSEDFKKCKKWLYDATTYLGGAFDPRNIDIVDLEKDFDFLFTDEWAEYSYTLADGTELNGHLGIRGFIDVVSRKGPDHLEILDYKTGSQKDFNTDELKDYNKLRNDIQLRVYHLAASRLYGVDHITTSIYFIKDGGVISMAFEKKDLADTEAMIRERFQEIKRIGIPELSVSWKCSRFCEYGKNLWPGTNKTYCEFIREQNQVIGVDQVMLLYSKPKSNA